jgi:transposase InsO family protein
VALILRIREERRYSAVRASLYLQRHYHAYVSPTTIWKIFHRHHVGPIAQKKYRPGPKPPDAPLQVPGRSVQLDVKFVPRVGRACQRFYQFTAIDEATRFRVLRIYDHDNTKTAIDFLREVREHFPFAIQKIQPDNGSSFGPQFTWHLSDLRISRRHIPPGCPEVNGKVQRSHKIDSQEFYQEGISNIKGILLESSRDGRPNTTKIGLISHLAGRRLLNEFASSLSHLNL